MHFSHISLMSDNWFNNVQNKLCLTTHTHKFSLAPCLLVYEEHINAIEQKVEFNQWCICLVQFFSGFILWVCRLLFSCQVFNSCAPVTVLIHRPRSIAETKASCKNHVVKSSLPVQHWVEETESNPHWDTQQKVCVPAKVLRARTKHTHINIYLYSYLTKNPVHMMSSDHFVKEHGNILEHDARVLTHELCITW